MSKFFELGSYIHTYTNFFLVTLLLNFQNDFLNIAFLIIGGFTFSLPQGMDLYV